MLKKVLLSVSLVAAPLLKADSEPKITIQRGGAFVTLTKQEYVNHLNTTFKFLKENEEESKLLKFFDKYEDNTKKIANISIAIAVIAQIFLPELARKFAHTDLRFLFGTPLMILLSLSYLSSMYNENRARMVGIEWPICGIKLGYALNRQIRQLINGEAKLINKKYVSLVLGVMTPEMLGYAVKTADALILKNYKNSWMNFAKNNSIIISANELVLYRSCYSTNLNENLILKQIQAYVDKISLS